MESNDNQKTQVVTKDLFFSLNAKQLSDLLSIGKSPTESHKQVVDEDRQLETLLQYMLESKITPEGKDGLTYTKILPDCKAVISSVAGEMHVDILLDASTSVEVLNVIKDYFKTIASMHIHENEYAVATVMYYCSIASAAVYHKQSISSLSDADLSDAFMQFNKKSWICREVKRLFSKAISVCNEGLNRAK